MHYWWTLWHVWIAGSSERRQPLTEQYYSCPIAFKCPLSDTPFFGQVLSKQSLNLAAAKKFDWMIDLIVIKCKLILSLHKYSHRSSKTMYKRHCRRSGVWGLGVQNSCMGGYGQSLQWSKDLRCKTPEVLGRALCGLCANLYW